MTMTTTAEIEAIERASHHWQRGGKMDVKCPDCGARGHPGEAWTHAHVAHAQCPECGVTKTVAGMHVHRGYAHAVHGSKNRATRARRKAAPTAAPTAESVVVKATGDEVITKLVMFALARDRDTDPVPRKAQLTDDEAILLLETIARR